MGTALGNVSRGAVGQDLRAGPHRPNAVRQSLLRHLDRLAALEDHGGFRHSERKQATLDRRTRGFCLETYAKPVLSLRDLVEDNAGCRKEVLHALAPGLELRIPIVTGHEAEKQLPPTHFIQQCTDARCGGSDAASVWYS